MVEEIKNQGGAQPGQDGGAKDLGDKVAYESYSRAVDEKKRFQKENDDLKARLDALEKQELESKGNLEGALASYKEENAKLQENLKTTKTAFARNQVHSKVESALAAKGCRDPKGAIRLMEDSDYQTLVGDVDDNFNVAQQTLELTIDKLQREKGYLFGKAAPKFEDGTPSNKENVKPKDAKTQAVNGITGAKTYKESQAALEAAMKLF